MIERGADPNQTNDDGLAPLYATIDMQFAPVIWQPNPPTDQENTTYLALMSLLLDRGADPNARLSASSGFDRAITMTHGPARRARRHSGAPRLPPMSKRCNCW